MAEFGEKLKQMREKNGMTQATLAEHLYVTRQAVSRWECGARYPDLLTTKKIAQILEVSIDELVSGEGLQKNIEREPILVKPVPNMMQTILYSVAAVIYLLKSIFAIKSLFPDESLAGTPAGEITWITVFSIVSIFLYFIAMAAGLIFSARNTLTPKRTGIIMSAPYGIAAARFVFTVIHMQIQKNGYMPWTGWIDGFLIYAVSFVCIILYFHNGKLKIPPIVIYGIAAVSILGILYNIKVGIHYMTDLSFVLRTINYMGRLGLIVLLIIQTYIFANKMKTGINQK